VAKPVKHTGKWRIRWLDERGKRQSAVFDDYKCAQTNSAAGRSRSKRSSGASATQRRPKRRSTTCATTGSTSERLASGAARTTRASIRKHLRPAFGAMKVREVGVEEVDGYINVKVDDGSSPRRRSHHVTLLPRCCASRRRSRCRGLWACPSSESRRLRSSAATTSGCERTTRSVASLSRS